VTSESLLDLVTPLLPEEVSRRALVTLKDKLACRQLLEPLFPGITAQTVPLHDLPSFPFDPGQSYVVKPVRACFGSGVRVVTPGADLHGIVAEIAAKVERHRDVLSDGVLSADTLIVELYINGEEYAVDMFYDKARRPVITGICHHPMPHNPAYLHLLYTTSRELFAQFYDPLVQFFTAFNQLLGVRSFPIHAEFRLQNGHLVPIEFNPLRFGGMGLAGACGALLGGELCKARHQSGEKLLVEEPHQASAPQREEETVELRLLARERPRTRTCSSAANTGSWWGKVPRRATPPAGCERIVQPGKHSTRAVSHSSASRISNATDIVASC
jgi:hypothetical protein